MESGKFWGQPDKIIGHITCNELLVTSIAEFHLPLPIPWSFKWPQGAAEIQATNYSCGLMCWKNLFEPNQDFASQVWHRLDFCCSLECGLGEQSLVIKPSMTRNITPSLGPTWLHDICKSFAIIIFELNKHKTKGNKRLMSAIVWFQKISIPPTEGFFGLNPSPLEFPVLLHTFL